MSDIVESLEALRENAAARIVSAVDLASLEQLRVEFIGRKGELASLGKLMGGLPPDARAEAGRLLNLVKQTLTSSLDDRQSVLQAAAFDQQMRSEWVDVTLPASGPPAGSLHPITQMQGELERLFSSMGFMVLDGPEVETEFYNFDALNIPADHPAREMQDTFWLTNGQLLRTHTSPTQVRGLEKYSAPIRMIAPGRVFRNEEVDASHEHTFYQLEGMMVDRDISVANVIFFMTALLTEVFKRQVTVRLRPGYFPFVEPGFELDIRCLICNGDGCSVCKHTGWVELLPCGLVHPRVLASSGVDPNEWSGFAFGLGLTRLAMMRYAISDIRLLQSGDLRFLNQF